MTEPKSTPSRRLLAAALTITLIAIFGSVGVLFYLGVFASAVVEQAQAPAYRMAYLPHTGRYDRIGTTLEEVERRLRAAGMQPQTPCALYYDDPSVTPQEQLRSNVGFLVDSGAQVPGNVQIETIAPRAVLRATFRGSPVIGSHKAYAAMREWIKARNLSVALPSFEIYHPDGMIEYQLTLVGGP